MGGAATAIEKTDWTPLAGKTVVVIMPDHDGPDRCAADAVVPRLRQVGATVRRVTVPQDKPKEVGCRRRGGGRLRRADAASSSAFGRR